MRIFLSIVRFFHYVWVLAGIAFLYAISVGPAPLDFLRQVLTPTMTTPGGQYILAGTAVILLLIELEFLYLKVKTRQRNRYIVLKQADGRVWFAVAALEEYIKKVCAGFPEIKEVSPRVYPQGKKVKVVLDLSLNQHVQAASLADEIQRNIQSQMHHILGIPKGVQIQMRVKEVSDKTVEILQEKMLRGF